MSEPWNGQGTFQADSAQYYGGMRQADVKPTPDSPVLKLGMDKVPPIITSAVPSARPPPRKLQRTA